MTTELKKKIVTAAKAYMKQHDLSQNAMSSHSGINGSYLSPMLKGEFRVGDMEIAERWFLMLAEAVGMDVKKTYWKVQQTPQFMQIIAALEEAKKHGMTRMLVGPTGCGKTFAVDKFCKNNPMHTFRITVSSLYRLPDMVNELMDLTGVNDISGVRDSKWTRQSMKARIDRVIDKLQAIKLQGGFPILIIDEGENMELALMKCLKGLYDQLKDYCAFVLLGTHRMVDRMHGVGSRNKTAGVPELYRRFQAGHKVLPSIDPAFNLFLASVEDEGLRKLLPEVCNNYGVLRDYLEPALRKADEAGKPLTEEFFRVMYNMPKQLMKIA